MADAGGGPAGGAGSHGAAGLDGDLRDQVRASGWVLSHPVMQGTASATGMRAEGIRIQGAAEVMERLFLFAR